MMNPHVMAELAEQRQVEIRALASRPHVRARPQRLTASRRQRLAASRAQLGLPNQAAALRSSLSAFFGGLVPRRRAASCTSC